MTPYKALYGRDPPALIKYEVSDQDEVSLQDISVARDKSLDQLKYNMFHAQQFMQNYADKERRELEFEVGALVLVKLQPYSSIEEKSEVECEIFWAI